MFQLLLYYRSFVFFVAPVALFAFCVIWWQQKSHLPTSLGVLKLLGLFTIVWGACFATFAILHFATSLSGMSNLAAFEQPYMIVAGLIGYIVGNSVIGRMLKSKG